LMLAFFVLVELATVRAIVDCTAASQVKGYPGLVRHYLGPAWGTMFSGVIAVYCFFAATAAFIIIKNVTTPLLMLASHHEKPFWTSEYFQVAVAGAFVFPLLCLRQITSLRFTAMLSFGAILFVTFVVTYQFFHRGAVDTSVVGPLDSWGSWPSAVLAVPNIMLSLQSHIQVPSIYADMRSDLRSVGRMMGAVVVAYALIVVLYSTVAVFGLATFHRATKPDIMECDYAASDGTIIMARICLALTATFSVPVNHHPAREAVWSMLSSGSDDEMPSRVFIAETVCFWLLAVGLGMCIGELSTLNDLMGLSAGVAVIFVLPGCFLLKPASTPARLSFTSQGPTMGRSILMFAALALVLCIYSFIGSEFLDIATRTANQSSG